YPTFFLATLDYLPIQGSAVPCKRVFSSAKEMMTDRRNHVGEHLMEALQMLKFSFRQGHGLDFSVGMSSDEVKAYLEVAALREISCASEDANAFRNTLIAEANGELSEF
ncbi:hypothetical protein BJ165DRAFT_1357322, partial [Panaeolus papilionaceus]